MRLSPSFSTRLARVVVATVCFAWPVFGLLPNDTTAVDLSPTLQSIIEDHGLVAAAAFGASSTGVCAIGSAGALSSSTTTTTIPVRLWDSPWHAGSLTKSMTASLAALLVKDDAVNLNYETTVGEVFENSVAESPYSKVTLEQLLCHRGGFQTDFIASVEDIDKLLDLATKDEESMPLLEQRGTLVQHALTLNPATTPGEGFLYSNVGYLIAGHMMESVSGMAWEDLMVDRLFASLGMQSAYFGCPDTPHAPLGHDYKSDLFGGGLLIPMAPDPYCDCLAVIVSGCTCLSPHLSRATIPFPAALGGPAGGVHMQLSDFVRYYQWHLAGERGGDTSGLLSTDEFHRLHSGIGEEVPDEHGVPHMYGHGWQIYEEYNLDNPYGINGTLLWHDGSNLLWLAQVWMAPDMDRVYFTVTNSYRTASGVLAFDALDAIVESMVNSTLSVQDAGECPSIESLEQGSDPGSHAACPAELVYGETIVPIAPESCALWKSSCFFLYALTVAVMVF